jgi:hypothetical protein
MTENATVVPTELAYAKLYTFYHKLRPFGTFMGVAFTGQNRDQAGKHQNKRVSGKRH